jgi:hypothetical protein
MSTLRRLVAPPEEASGTGGTTIASATRATSSHVAMSSKKYNNLLTYLATSMTQGLKAKLHPQPAFTTLPRSISGRRSMMAVTHGASLRQEEGTVLTGTTTTMKTTASPPSPPTSLKNPIPRILNQLKSPSMTASRTRASGSDATPLPSRSQGDPTPLKHSTSR